MSDAASRQGPLAGCRLWAWHISAWFYARTYGSVAHEADADLLHYVGPWIDGAVVADCGCGPGILALKLLEAGATRVVAIDSNRRMLEQAARRLAQKGVLNRTFLAHDRYEGNTLSRIRADYLGGAPYDIILFKRSLYLPRSEAIDMLFRAASALSDRGVIVVVHPESSLRRYAFSSPWGVKSYTLFHLFNRGIARVAERCGLQHYKLYSPEELDSLMAEAVPGATIDRICTRQRSFNIVAVRRGSSHRMS